MGIGIGTAQPDCALVARRTGTALLQRREDPDVRPNYGTGRSCLANSYPLVRGSCNTLERRHCGAEYKASLQRNIPLKPYPIAGIIETEEAIVDFQS